MPEMLQCSKAQAGEAVRSLARSTSHTSLYCTPAVVSSAFALWCRLSVVPGWQAII
jgi:hypothetical protein